MRNRIRENKKERNKRKHDQLTDKIETLREHTNSTTGRGRLNFDHFPREGTEIIFNDNMDQDSGGNHQTATKAKTERPTTEPPHHQLF